MSTPRMTAQDALALFERPDAQPTPTASVGSLDETPSGYVAYHPEKGVFIGVAPGEVFGVSGSVALWSGIQTAGQSTAVLFEDPDLAREYFVQSGAARPEMLDDLEYFETTSPHWSDLQAIGLNVHDMPFNGHANSFSTTLH